MALILYAKELESNYSRCNDHYDRADPPLKIGGLPHQILPVSDSHKMCRCDQNIEVSPIIDGIYHVVDPLFSERKAFFTNLCMDSLAVTPISQASVSEEAPLTVHRGGLRYEG